jgi:transposase
MAVIPANCSDQRSFDRHRYRDRNLVEQFFCRMKQFRRIDTRYEELAARYSAFIALAAFIWLA